MTTPPSADVDALPPPPPETFGQRLTYWQYRTMWGIAARMPDRLAWKLPRWLGRLFHGMASGRQEEQVRRNLARVAGHPPGPELDALVREAYVEYGRYWLDSFRLHRMDPQQVLSRTTGDGLENLQYLTDIGGGIVATCHLGSWDVGAYFCYLNNWPLTVVAELLEPRRLFDRFLALRRDIGLEVVPLVPGGDMVTRLEQHVRAGRIATLLADRDLTKKGPVVEFFGEPCRLPPGPAALARRTGKPVSAGAFLATPDGWHADVRAPVDISHLSIDEGTQVVAHELEHLIGTYPAQWHVFVRNWLADREPDHPAVAGS